MPRVLFRGAASQPCLLDHSRVLYVARGLLVDERRLHLCRRSEWRATYPRLRRGRVRCRHPRSVRRPGQKRSTRSMYGESATARSRRGDLRCGKQHAAGPKLRRSALVLHDELFEPCVGLLRLPDDGERRRSTSVCRLAADERPALHAVTRPGAPPPAAGVVPNARGSPRAGVTQGGGVERAEVTAGFGSVPNEPCARRSRASSLHRAALRWPY
jgi:hypothetical protein